MTNWGAVMEIAGRLGMSEAEFELTTPRYLFHRQKAFEALQTEHWQRTRLEAFYAFLPHTKKNALRRPSDLFKLPGDEWQIEENEKKQLAEYMKKVKNLDVFGGETLPKAQA